MLFKMMSLKKALFLVVFIAEIVIIAGFPMEIGYQVCLGKCQYKKDNCDPIGDYELYGFCISQFNECKYACQNEFNHWG